MELAQKAITAALSGNWEEAISVNENLLHEDPQDVEALNRLSRAYAESGDINNAKKYAENVLKIDPYNSIATKSLAKWQGVSNLNSSGHCKVCPEVFLEEPGKTKIVNLMNLGDPSTLAKIDTGDEVVVNTHCHRISVDTKESEYVGRLPDDLSARIHELSERGNQYSAYIKSVTPDEVKVFLREVKRGEKTANIPSFPIERTENTQTTSTNKLS